MGRIYIEKISVVLAVLEGILVAAPEHGEVIAAIAAPHPAVVFVRVSIQIVLY